MRTALPSSSDRDPLLWLPTPSADATPAMTQMPPPANSAVRQHGQHLTSPLDARAMSSHSSGH